MRIFDENNKEIYEPNLNIGQLIEATRPLTHRYKITQQEKGHYETVKEFPNGGKEVRWVVDVPEEGRWVTYDENNNEVEFDGLIPDDMPREQPIKDFEEILRYRVFGESELITNQKIKIEMQISDLQKKLSDSNSPIGDWKLIKNLEYKALGKTPPYDMAEYSKQRQNVRDEINRLEEEIGKIEAEQTTE